MNTPNGSSSPSNTNGIGIIQTINKLPGTKEAHIKFTIDNDAGTAATNDVHIFAGRGVIANKTLPTGVTMSDGDFATIADWYDFWSNTAVHIKYLRMGTDVVGNWQKVLELSENTPNLKGIVPTTIPLSNYQEVGGGSVLGNLTVKDEPINTVTVNQNLNLIFKAMLKNSYVDIYVGYDAYQETSILVQQQ